MADEAAVRRVHDDGRATWLVRVAGFLAPQPRIWGRCLLTVVSH